MLAISKILSKRIKSHINPEKRDRWSVSDMVNHTFPRGWSYFEDPFNQQPKTESQSALHFSAKL